MRKVDAAANKITIKHGAMKKFDMEDGMTMVYAVLKSVKAGDKVKFDADHTNGQYIVSRRASDRAATRLCLRETAAAVASARAKGVLAVEMEAAALYAFARDAAKPFSASRTSPTRWDWPIRISRRAKRREPRTPSQ